MVREMDSLIEGFFSKKEQRIRSRAYFKDVVQLKGGLGFCMYSCHRLSNRGLLATEDVAPGWSLDNNSLDFTKHHYSKTIRTSWSGRITASCYSI